MSKREFLFLIFFQATNQPWEREAKITPHDVGLHEPAERKKIDSQFLDDFFVEKFHTVCAEITNYRNFIKPFSRLKYKPILKTKSYGYQIKTGNHSKHWGCCLNVFTLLCLKKTFCQPEKSFWFKMHFVLNLLERSNIGPPVAQERPFSKSFVEN